MWWGLCNGCWIIRGPFYTLLLCHCSVWKVPTRNTGAIFKLPSKSGFSFTYICCVIVLCERYRHRIGGWGKWGILRSYQKPLSLKEGFFLCRCSVWKALTRRNGCVTFIAGHRLLLPSLSHETLTSVNYLSTGIEAWTCAAGQIPTVCSLRGSVCF